MGFRGIPNRNELVLRTHYAMFINDSSSVMPASVGFTVDNFENLPVHIICGGSDTGLDPSPMVKALKNVASVHLLEGSFTNDILIPKLKENGIEFTGPHEKMEEAVKSASSKLDKNSNTSLSERVLNSAICSSNHLFLIIMHFQFSREKFRSRSAFLSTSWRTSISGLFSW